MKWTVATFNVNSVRARLPVLLSWLASSDTDVVCLQETKVQNPQFPEAVLRDAGYHAVYCGEKSYNGVAILSKQAPTEVRAGFDDGGPEDAARLLTAEIDGVTVINTYVPQGRDVDHPMYRYKLEWFERLRAMFASRYAPEDRLVWMGDINVAPTRIDVHDPDRLMGHVCFNPEVSTALETVKGWGWVDVFRRHVPGEGQYTYYDYRAPSAVKNGKGWRIDHIHATRSLAERSVNAWIDLGPRQAEKPSDHTPLLAAFDRSAEQAGGVNG